MTDDKKKKITRWFWILLCAPFAVLVLVLLLVWMFASIPSFEELEHPDSMLATQLIADDGRVLTTFHIENRTSVEYSDLSPNIIAAAISTEDIRFHSHSGVDFRGLFRVAFKTLLMSDSSQGGGSTITQQLAKTLYPRDESPGKLGMIWIKLKEWITAIKLERNYTKDEILTMYLNSLFFGSSAFGIKSASETFFNKQPSDLTVEEAASLMGMVNKPTRYNPVLNPDKALARRNFVIDRMAKSGYLTEHEADSIKQVPINLVFHVRDHNAGVAPYFRDKIRRDMSATKPRRDSYEYPEDYAADSLRWVNDELYGWIVKNKKPNGEHYNLDKDGLHIYTTINYEMQKNAEEAVVEWLGGDLQKKFDSELKYKKHAPFANNTPTSVIDRLMTNARRWSSRYVIQKKAGVPESEILAQFDKPQKMQVFSWNKKGYIDTVMTPNDSILYYKKFLRCAMMAVEPETGYVKAYVGGPDYRYFKYDNVSQGKRQVGSTIKPFLYTLAMHEGMSPCDKVLNVPQTFMTGNKEWTPRSTDKAEWIGQTVTLKWGLTHSSNNISAYLMKQFGPHAMAEMMHRMGISSHIDEVDALCVGPADIAVGEMVPAYNTFPSKGVYTEPVYVTRIEDSQGNVITQMGNRKREAIGERIAYLMINLMEGVVNSGTGGRLRSVYRLQGPIGGKTGTTNDNSDGWFIGYTPRITCGVWVGGEDRQIHFNSIALGGGSNMALPIWGIWMKKCIADGLINESDQFQAPAGFSAELGCSGGDISSSGDGTEENDLSEGYYFD